MSAPTGAADGTIKGATCHTPALAHMAASRTSMRAAGLSPADRTHSAGGSHDIGAAKRPMVDAHDTGDCAPCLRTIWLPISPTGHSRLAY
jgi:hypothetical protein